MRKRPTYPSLRRMRVKLSDFRGVASEKAVSTLPCDFAQTCYNFRCENGRIRSAEGFGALRFAPENGALCPPLPPIAGDKTLFVARSARRDCDYTTLVVSYDGGLWALDFRAGAYWVNRVAGARCERAVPYLYKGKDLLLMASDAEPGMTVFDGETITKAAQALKIRDLCVHYERVFAVVEGKRDSVWFSALFDPYDWTVSADSGGYIDFDGTLGGVNRVKSFGEYLYVFCDFGIFRLTAFGEQEGFSLRRVACACGRIYADTVADCGDRMIFAADGGVYLFDGYAVRRCDCELADLFGKRYEGLQGICRDRRYYLRADCADGCRIAVIDTEKGGSSVIRGVEVDQLRELSAHGYHHAAALSADGRVAVLEEGAGTFGALPDALWKIEGIDFGDRACDKIIRAVEYDAEHAYVLGIVCGGVTHEYALSPRAHYKAVCVRGRKFDFYIRCAEKNALISPPYIVADLLKR